MEADPWVLIKKYKFPLIIIGVGILGYFNMLFNGFVWDDKTYIINNQQIHTLNILTLIKENLFNMSGQYRPLPSIYFAYIFAIFSDASFPYHIIQLALHITCTL
ncbi:MAG: hypothetical protein KGJ07_08365, partial [Patescibacteria group bacterium]|nr:hypothetical protein [Patescibacteria group bacterium]